MSDKRERPPIRVTDRRQSASGGEEPSGDQHEPTLEAQKLAEDRLDQLKRLKADFENYRTRVIREQTDLVERASLRIVERLLPVLDDLERALEAAKTHEADERSSSAARGSGGAAPRSDERSSSAARGSGGAAPRSDERSSSEALGVRGAQGPRSQDAIVRGIELVYKHLHEVLVDEGLERVQAEGAFDPQEHEAVSSVAGDVGEPTVLEVVRPGYKLKGKTIRPALVHVSVPGAASDSPPGESE